MNTIKESSVIWFKACVLFLLMVFVTETVCAATNIWIGLGADSNWTTPENWTNGMAPVGASDLVVKIEQTNNIGTVTVPMNQNISDPLDLNRLATADVTGNPDRNVYLNGGAFRFVTNGVVQPSLLHDRDAPLYLRTPVILSAGSTLVINNRTYGIDFEAPISGEGGFNFGSGSMGGELSLKNATNSYSGGTAYINTAGANASYTRLYVYATNALGTGPVTLSGGNTNPLGAGNQQAGGLTFIGMSAHTNTFSLLATSPVFAGLGVTNETVTAANVTLGGPFDLKAYTLYLRGQRNTSGTISGVIAGTGSAAIVKMDLGPWTLSGANTFTGRVTVSNGTLKLGAADAVLPVVPVTVNGGTYDLGGLTVTNDVVTISSGALSNGTLCASSVAGTDAGTVLASLSGSGGVAKSGAGTLTLSAANTYSGVTTASAGLLQFAKRVALYNADTAQWTTTNIIVSSGATLGLNVGGTGEFTDSDVGLLAGLGSATGGFKSGALLGLDTTNAAGGTFACSSVIGNPGGNMLGLLKLGLGTLVLSGANSYTGATRITSGVLSIGSIANGGLASGIGSSSNAAAKLVFDGGALRYTGATASTDRRFTVNAGKNAIFDVTQAGTTLTFAAIKSSGVPGGTIITKNGPGTLVFGLDGNTTDANWGYLAGIDCFVLNEGSFFNVANDTPQINVSRQAANGPALILGDGAYLGCSFPVDVLASNTEQVVRYIGTNATATITAGVFSGPGTGGSNTKTFDVNDGAADIDLLVSASYGIYSATNYPAVSDIRKTGAGTLKLTGTASDFRGTTTVRNGRIVVSASVLANTAGPLGKTNSVVQVADAGTSSTNTVALVFDGAYTFARGICVYPYTNGASVSVGSVATNSAVFSGAILLSNTVQLTSASAGTNAVIVTGVISGPGGVTKTGTGTVVLAAANLYTGLTTVAAGTLRLSSSNRIDDASALRLTGGTFATAGFSETLGELDVDGAAVIDFGSGSSTLRFAASTGQVWAGTLTLRNWSRTDSDRLFVGTWAGALTPAQLAKIVLPDGRKAMQLATGEVVPPQGAVMMVR
jgi:autotransporter-associated beta strand protein